MDEFVDRMLGDRRTLHQALGDIVAKYNRVPRGKHRSMLARMIEVLDEEIGESGIGASHRVRVPRAD